MTFTFQNKPDAADLLSVSQVDLKNNAQYFQAALNKDHQIVFGDTNATTGEGRHRTVSLLNAGGTPAWPADGTSGQFYVVAGVLFYQSNSGNTQIPIAGPATDVATNSCSVFFNGLFMKFGTVTCNPGTTLITYNGAFTSFVRSIVITPNFVAAGVVGNVYVVGAPGKINFSVWNGTAASATVSYIALGV